MISLDEALRYHDIGLSIVPATARKTPTIKGWDRYQNEPPTAGQVREWFGGDDQAGIAIVAGKASMGGLAVRDFDTLDSYDRWAADHPTLARTLPTAITHRGRHVYCLTDIDAAHRAMRASIKVYGDGELRAGGYCIAPSSSHLSGHIYVWHTPISGDIPQVDLAEAGFLQCDTADTGIHSRLMPLIGGSAAHAVSHQGSEESGSDWSDKEKIEFAIAKCIPTASGQRNRMLFELAREFKAIPSLASQPVTALKGLVKQWHDAAINIIATKPFAESWLDFAVAWEKVKYAADVDPIGVAFAAASSRPPPACAREYEPKMQLLAALCRELGEIAGGKPFFLSCRVPVDRLGVDHSTVSRWLRVLMLDNVIKLVTKGSQKGRKASEFLYTGDD